MQLKLVSLSLCTLYRCVCPCCPPLCLSSVLRDPLQDRKSLSARHSLCTHLLHIFGRHSMYAYLIEEWNKQFRNKLNISWTLVSLDFLACYSGDALSDENARAMFAWSSLVFFYAFSISTCDQASPRPSLFDLNGRIKHTANFSIDSRTGSPKFQDGSQFPEQIDGKHGRNEML